MIILFLECKDILEKENNFFVLLPFVNYKKNIKSIYERCS